MADKQIDSLELQITSNAQKASNAIDSLVKKLGNLSDALSPMKLTGLSELSNGVMRLSRSMAEFKMSGASKADFNRVANGLSALSSANVQGLATVSQAISNLSQNMSGLPIISGGIKELSQAMGDFKAYGVGKTDFNKIANGLERLSAVNMQGILTLPSSISDLSKSLTSLSEIQINADSIKELANTIGMLGRKTVTNAVKNIPLLTGSIKNMANELNGVSMNGFDLSSLSNLATAIRSLGGSAASKAAGGNITALATALKQMMRTLSTAPRVSQNVIQMTNALANLASKGGRAGTAANSLSGGLHKVSSSAKKAQVSSKGLVSAIGLLYAKFFLLIRGVKALGKAVTSAMDYLETFNFLEVVTGKIGTEYSSMFEKYGYESAETYADSFQRRLNELTTKMTGFTVGDAGQLTMADTKNLGMDPNALMEYQATIASITNASGMAGESSLMASKALSMLAGDMSSLRNVDLSQTMQNFQSALIGQTEAVYKYGIDLTEASLKQTALNNGLKVSLSNLTQNAKMQLRLLTILEQSKVAWGDLGRTIESPSNQLRILTQNFSNLARMIGNLFLPVVQTVLPYINGMVIALQRLINWIGGFLGVENNISSIGGVSDSIGGIEDSADGAAGAVSELKKTVMGFDEANILSEKSSKGSSSGGAGDIDLSDQIAASLADYEKVWNEALQNSESRMTEFADKIEAAFKKVKKAAEPTLTALKKLYNDGIKKLTGFSTGALHDLFKVLGDIGTWMLGDDSGLPRFFDITNKLLNNINWDSLRDSINKVYSALKPITEFVWTGLMDFYERFLVPLGAWVMNEAIPELADIFSKLSDMIDWEALNAALRNLWDALAPFAAAIGEGLISFFSSLAELGTEFLNLLAPFFNALADAISKIDPETAKRIGESIGLIATALTAFNLIKTAATAFSSFIGALASHPYTVIAGGLLAVLNAIKEYGMEKLGANEVMAFRNEMDELVDSTSKANEKISELAESYDADAKSYDDQAKRTKELADEYFKLYQKSERTKDEELKLKEIMGKLMDTYPLLSDKVDKQTGYLTLEKDEVYKLIDAETERLKRTASQEVLIEMYKEQAKQAAAVEEATQKLRDAQVAFSEAGYTGLETISEMTPEYLRMKTQINDATKAQQEARGEYDKSVDTINRYKEKLGLAADEVYYDTKQIMENTEGLLVSTEKGIEFAAAGMEEAAAGALLAIDKNFKVQTPIIQKTSEGYGDGMSSGVEKGFQSSEKEINQIIDEIDDTVQVEFKQMGDEVVDKFGNGISNNRYGANGDITNLLSEISRTISNYRLPSINVKILPDTSALNNMSFGGMTAGVSGFRGYAVGGFPEVGEYFLARENGPELVGRIGNRTAVANNDQITDALVSVVTTAIMPMVSAISNLSKSGDVGEAIVELDGERVGKVVGNIINRQNRRMKPVIR